MNQQNINQPDEFQTITEETFFEPPTVQAIPAVVPLDETPTRTRARFQKYRVPMRKPDNSFNPAFLIMALMAVTALGVIAGTMLYRASEEKSASNTALETDEPANRTIPAPYQFIVEKPSSQSLSKDNSTLQTAPAKKNSRDKQESSATGEENNQESVPVEETVEENNEEVSNEETEEPPPIRRDRKEDKKQDKPKVKNKNTKPEIKENEKASDEDGAIDR